jgi:uncharacterized protein YkwD
MRRTRRIGLLAALVAVATLSAGCFSGQSGGGGVRSVSFYSVDQRTQDVYRLVNNDRGFWGHPPVYWNDKLGGLATGWSEWMAASGVFGHQNLGAILNNPNYGEFWSLGENILLGPCSMSAQAIEQAWMASDGHRANILGDYNVAGVGITCTSGGQLYATEEFGKV